MLAFLLLLVAQRGVAIERQTDRDRDRQTDRKIQTWTDRKIQI